LHGKLTVHKHLGSYSNESEKLLLINKAKDFILKSSRQISLLDLIDSPKLNDIEITNSQPNGGQAHSGAAQQIDATTVDPQ